MLHCGEARQIMDELHCSKSNGVSVLRSQKFAPWTGSFDRQMARYDSVGYSKAGMPLRHELREPSHPGEHTAMSGAIGDAAAVSIGADVRAAGASRGGKRAEAHDPCQVMSNPFRFATHEKAIALGEPYTHPCFGHLNKWGASPRQAKMFNATSSEKWATASYNAAQRGLFTSGTLKGDPLPQRGRCELRRDVLQLSPHTYRSQQIQAALGMQPRFS